MKFILLLWWHRKWQMWEGIFWVLHTRHQVTGNVLKLYFMCHMRCVAAKGSAAAAGCRRQHAGLLEEPLSSYSGGGDLSKQSWGKLCLAAPVLQPRLCSPECFFWNMYFWEIQHMMLENATTTADNKFLAKFMKGILGYRVFITKENLVLTFSI